MTKQERNKQYYEANKEAKKEYYKQHNENTIKYKKQWYQDNVERVKITQKQHYKNNLTYYKQHSKQYRESTKLLYHVVYLLPDHNYVGVTDNIYVRMACHKSQYKRNTDNWIELARFDTREEALKCEAEYHFKGYEGAQIKKPIISNGPHTKTLQMA